MNIHKNKMLRFPVTKSIIAIVALAIIFILMFFVLPTFAKVTYVSSSAQLQNAAAVASTTKPIVVPFVPQYVATPSAVKAIYMSQCVVGTPNFRQKLVNLIDTTEINSVVIDIKDYTGTISFRSTNPLLASASLVSCGAPDMQAFIATLHEKGIYVIGRITVFQDPFYTKAHPEQAVQSKSGLATVAVGTPAPWKDHKGLSFVDVSSRPYWDVVVELSKEARAIGFDELNYDYIRYPSDGNMSDAVYVNPNKAVALETFFKYLHDNVKPTGVTMSADLFGMTTVAVDDLGIGQVLDRAFPYFDYVDPMVYPSHFAPNFGGFGNPNTHVYQVIDYSMGEAVKRAEATTTRTDFIGAVAIASTSPVLYEKPSYPPTILRPWLQDFNYGGTYGPTEVDDQIKATYDVGLSSWLLWSASNIYTSSALQAN